MGWETETHAPLLSGPVAYGPYLGCRYRMSRLAGFVYCLNEAVPATLQVEGNGFLYKMVRHISGVLVAVGEGRLPPAAVSRMLEVGDNAPPGGCREVDMSGCYQQQGTTRRRVSPLLWPWS